MPIGRPVTPLNIETQPRNGCAFVCRHIKTKENVKCATASYLDCSRRGSMIKVLRAFSGEEPFFMVKIGSRNTEIKVLKFLCGAHHKKCMDTTGEYLWTGITWKDAIKQGMKFSQPNLMVKEATPAKVTKIRKTRKAKLPVEVPVEILPEVVEEVVSEVVSEVVEEVIAPKAVEQSNDEFEAELEAEHQATLAKLHAARG